MLEELDDQRLLDETLFAFTSDHGDSLGEHGERTHGLFVYDATTRVPLLIAGPGVPAGQRVDGVVRSLDLFPTIAELAGLEPSGPLDGASLRPLWRGKGDERTAYLETFTPRENFGWSELRGLRRSEVSGLLGRLPSRMGYQPTMGTELAELEERICTTQGAAITSVQAVYVPADDFTDPAITHTFGHLSALIVLTRERASQGFYPAVDPLRSESKMLTPPLVGQRHYNVARNVRATLANYEELKDVIAMLGLEELSREDQRRVHRARRLERFLTQPFFTTEQFTSLEGKMVDLEDTLEGCERILNDEFADYPEKSLYMIGAIDEAKKP